MQVHQFHPTPSFGDAIGNHLLSVRHLLAGMGYQSEIFCEQAPLHFEEQTRLLDRYAAYASPDNVLLCHFSLSYSPRTLDWLRQIPDRKVLVYHNITPHGYFVGINQVCLESAVRGRQQLDDLCSITEAGWGVSDYNARELADRGWQRLGVLPIILDPSSYRIPPLRRILRRYRGGLNLLAVGRVSPNKRLEDLILTFYYIKRFVRADARLLLVGSAGGMRPYLEYLQGLVSGLGLSDVEFVGHVSTRELVSYYACADVYLCMSEHEGVCVPLLESMHFGVPIVAYEAAAIPETLGGSGVLVRSKRHASVAELIGLLVEDQGLCRRVIDRQRHRLRDFLPGAVQGRLKALLADLCENG